MSQKRYFRIGTALFMALFLYACAAGQKQYDIGTQLGQAGKYKEAIAYLKQAIELEPGNTAYQKALADLIDSHVNKFVAQGTQALNSESPVTLTAINRAMDQLQLAREIAPDSPAVTDLSAKIESQQQVLLEDIQKLYSQAKQNTAAQEWVEAYFNLQQIQNRYPNYEDSFQLLNEVANKGSEAFYQKAQALFDREDFKGADEYLRKALSLRGDSRPAREMQALIRERNNKEYFIGRAREAITAQKWDRAVGAYERALEYDPENKDLRQLIIQVRTKAGEFNIRKSKELMDQGWLLQAFEAYASAVRNIDDPKDFKLNSLLKDLTDRAVYAAEQFKEQNRFGAAWFWFEKIRNVDPQYKDIFFLTQAMEDQIKQRVQKSIAVFDFNSPTDNKDAGVIVANNLITNLFNNASGDIKILERENLKSILEEMKLGQIGVVSANSAKEMGRVYGIDVAIMGSVLLYKVDSSVSQGTKSVRYQIGTKIEDNIEYLNWKAKHPTPNEKQLAEAPPAKVTVPEIAEKDYQVSNHKKVGFVQLSFRIVDVRTGENIQVRTIESKKTVQDETSAGLPEAKVKFDPLDIPTDTELLQKMTDEVVSELGREALRPLSNLEKTYFQEGEKLIRRRDRLEAAENFINAVFDERLKQIQGSPMTQQALENLDDIFRNYKIAIGG
ncbi:MAG: CsgG/HfaB family protein [Desulfobacterales bacterium]|nr:CsgG/HfaB family protein [Desulfobacterales bacterium]